LLLTDLFAQLCSFENTPYRAYSCIFQPFICAKISHQQYLPAGSVIELFIQKMKINF